jgi:hypothetical protein
MSPVTETSRLEKEYFCLFIIMEGFFYCLSGLNPNTSIALAKHLISAAKLVMYSSFVDFLSLFARKVMRRVTKCVFFVSKNNHKVQKSYSI